MRVLVTGATGFVGQHVVARLVSAGHDVTALARHVAQTTWPSSVRPVSFDLLRPSGLAAILRGHDRVVHAAGPVADPAGRAALRAAHVQGTKTLAQAAVAADVRGIVHISTLAVMTPPAPGTALEENAPVRERFPGWMHYAEAKRDAERVLQAHVRDASLRVCVLRPGIVLGAGDRYTTPRMLAALRRGGPVQIGAGTQRPPCVCVTDLADAVAAAIVQPASEQDAFLLSGPEPPTQAELWQWHARAAGLAVPRGHVPERLAMLVAGVLERIAASTSSHSPATRFDVFALSADVAVDARKAMSSLGWRPRAAYSDAILAAVQSVDSVRRRP